MAARAIRALSILLLAWQALVVQAHVHAPPTLVAANGPVHAVAQQTPARQRPDGPLDCPVCREIAHAGQYLTPGAVVLLSPVVVAPWRTATALPVLSLARPFHAWRSRAPPSPLRS